MSGEDERDVIRGLLAAVENAWRTGVRDAIADAIVPYLADDVVFRGPEFAEVARGAAACAESYAAFVREAVVHAYEASETSLDVSGDIAVATYHWSMKYEHDGTRYLESGHDVYCLIRQDGRWRILWRALVPQRTMTG